MAPSAKHGRWKARSRIPLLGEVAAGKPLEMFSVEETLDVPESMWQGRKVFALRVRGQSMIDAGIHDGDYLIVEPAQTADDGRTVVAEIDGQVTVKKLFRAPGGQVRLQPANPEMLPLIISGDQVRIRGLVVGVLRKFGFRPGPATARRATATRGDGTSGAPPGGRGRDVGSLAQRHRCAARALAHHRRAAAGARRARAGAPRAAGARPAGAARMVRAHHQAGAAPGAPRRREPHHPSHAAARRARRSRDDRSAPTGLTHATQPFPPPARSSHRAGRGPLRPTAMRGRRSCVAPDASRRVRVVWDDWTEARRW